MRKENGEADEGKDDKTRKIKRKEIKEKREITQYDCC